MKRKSYSAGKSNKKLVRPDDCDVEELNLKVEKLEREVKYLNQAIEEAKKCTVIYKEGLMVLENFIKAENEIVEFELLDFLESYIPKKERAGGCISSCYIEPIPVSRRNSEASLMPF